MLFSLNTLESLSQQILETVIVFHCESVEPIPNWWTLIYNFCNYRAEVEKTISLLHKNHFISVQSPIFFWCSNICFTCLKGIRHPLVQFLKCLELVGLDQAETRSYELNPCLLLGWQPSSVSHTHTVCIYKKARIRVKLGFKARHSNMGCGYPRGHLKCCAQHPS